MSTIVTRAGKGSALTHNEVDANFVNLNTDKIEAAQSVTLTNKTISGSNNTLSNIGNSSLTNSSVTLGSTSISLGSTVTSVSGLTLSSPTVNTPTLSGGTINNASVGATTPSSGAFTTLSATGVTTVQAGTVSAPAITTSGDTNTGIYFPSADTVAIGTGGTERLRVDSAGNLGLGVTPSAWPGQSASYYVAQFGRTAVYDVAGTAGRMSYNAFIDSSGTNKYIANGFATRYDQGSGTHEWRIAASGTAGNAITFTQAMTLDASGNLMLGATTASGAFYIQNSTNPALRMGYGGANALHELTWDSADFVISADRGNAVASNLIFRNDGSERMRIDSSGNVGIGTSSPAAKLTVSGTTILGTGAWPTATSGLSDSRAGVMSPTENGQFFVVNTNGTVAANNGGEILLGATATTSTADAALPRIGGYKENATSGNFASYLAFKTTNSTGTTFERARITSGGEVYIAGTTDQGAYNLQCNGTGVWGAGAYVNGSDERIKEDIQPITSGLDVVTKLNPVTYRYKEDWSKDQSIQTGFIAQELLVAMEGQNYVDGVVQQGGSEGYYSVAYQNIIPLLTKAIQEQQAMIDELKAKVAALENA